MSKNKGNVLIETDARSILTQLEPRNGESSSAVVNNNMLVNHQSSSSTNLIFEGCNNITMGNLVNIGWSPGASAGAGTIALANPQSNPDLEDSRIYRKTPTIKQMMESQIALEGKYLDMFCENFGHHWRAVPVLLGINELFVEKMYEDHKLRGTGEVTYQVLLPYFQSHPEKATVGWFTQFLWRNGFRRTITTVKELYRKLRELDEEDD